MPNVLRRACLQEAAFQGVHLDHGTGYGGRARASTVETTSGSH